jgi:hypothetical protein
VFSEGGLRVRDGCNDIAMLPVTNGYHSAEDISSNSVRQITALIIQLHAVDLIIVLCRSRGDVGLQSV